MIISHAHRYVFVELPHTGSSSVSRELREQYAGKRILHKHARYSEFLRSCSREERDFFVFSAIRNPLDETVSIYERYRTDHKGRYSQRRKWVTKSDIELFEFVRRTGPDFPAFFSHFYRWPIPYDNFSSEAHERFDYVMRFENLAADFAIVLGLLGISPNRSLPVVNATAEKGSNFVSYYPPDIVPRAKWIFGPFMDRWGYSFPPEWGSSTPPASSKIAYQLFGQLRSLYRRRIHGRSAVPRQIEA